MGQVGGKAQLDETYFVQKVKLGQGTFGTVWRARHRANGHTVAIKQLDKASLPRRGVSRKDIEREVSMMKACDHINITKLFDTFEDDTSIYLALEYCDGGDFGDKVNEIGLAMTEVMVAEWMQQICAALDHLHAKNICHRDIKPDNFMVADERLLKLADFGLAVYVPPGTLLTDKCGTPAFMAPEQHQMPRLSRGYNFAADMWAAGVSMYMVMFGGKHPFLTSRGGLDEKLLLNGTLDFRDTEHVAAKGLNFLGLGHIAQLRFSDHCRSFCQNMVVPNQETRLTARAALQSPWLQAARPPAPKARAGPTRASSVEPLPVETPMRARQRNASMERPSGHPKAAAAGGAAAGAAAAVAPVKFLAQKTAAAAGAAAGAVKRLAPGAGAAAPSMPSPPPGPTAAELQRQRELEEIRRLQAALEQEKRQVHDLQKQKTKDASALERTAVSEQVPDSSLGLFSNKILAAGTRCRYDPTSSSGHGLLAAVVEGYNEDDGTYNLDIRKHASPDRIAPVRDASVREAWPRGFLVAYFSDSVKKWLPAEIKSYNVDDFTYNLDIREHADCDRIRAQLDRRFAPVHMSDVGPPVVAAGSDLSKTSSARKPARETTRHFKDSAGAEGPMRTPSPEGVVAPGVVMSPAGATPSIHVGPGFWCLVPEHGLAVIDSWKREDNSVEVELGACGGQKLQVKFEVLRAPNESRCCWPKGTAVSYLSPSAGGWIDAQVVTFNGHTLRYDLDVRMEADPDKIRPR